MGSIGKDKINKFLLEMCRVMPKKHGTPKKVLISSASSKALIYRMPCSSRVQSLEPICG
jgi:hypothetical protein